MGGGSFSIIASTIMVEDKQSFESGVSYGIGGGRGGELSRQGDHLSRQGVILSRPFLHIMVDNYKITTPSTTAFTICTYLNHGPPEDLFTS